MGVVALENNMKKGFITLYIVIILGSISLGLILMYSSNSLIYINSIRDNKNGAKTEMLVNSCAEVVLETIRENTGYTGTDSLSIDGNTCSYSVSILGLYDRVINISGSVGESNRSLEINVDAFNPIHIVSWQEI